MLRNREGFTLIELLIVVVIIGILAAIALPKFGQTRERAYVSAMQSDLRNLQTAQEMYYSNPANDYTYWDGTLDADTPSDDDLGFTVSEGVDITVAAPDGGTLSEGYTATAGHASNDDLECTLTVGGTGSQGIVCDGEEADGGEEA